MDWLDWARRLASLLYGIRLAEGERLLEWRLVWEGMASGWTGKLLVVLAAAAALVLPVLFYYREPQRLSAASRVGLALLRVGWLCLLALVLAGPAVHVLKAAVPPGEVALLLDVSRSMAVEDVGEPAEAAAAPGLARIEAVKQALAGRDGLLARLARTHEVVVFTFSESLSGELMRVPKGAGDIDAHGRAPLLAELKADGMATSLGGAVASALNALRGRQVSALVAVTDGASNTGPDPVLAARQSAREFVPVHAIGVGRPHLADAAVSYVFVDDVLFKEDEAVASVGIRTDALDVPDLTLEVLAGDERLAERKIPVVGGEQAINVRFKPSSAGELLLRFRIPRHPAELVVDNNEQARKVRVIEDKIKVLLVEDEPRWEYRYLREALRRDRRINLKTYLASASRSLMRTQEEFLAAFPEAEAELFRYDAVILGDIQPAALGGNGLRLVERFVGEMAGALVVIAGERQMPWRFHGTALEEMLPVKITGDSTSGLREGFQLELTARALEEGSPLDLGTGKLQNSRAWKELPPLHWCAEAVKAKPFANLLAVRAGEPEPLPVIAACIYGRGGKVLYVGTDELWRMRFRPGPSAYEKAWVQLVQSVAMARLLGQTKRAMLSTDRREYPAGSLVKISARVLDDDFRPVRDANVLTAVRRGGHELERIRLAAVPERPDTFAGEWRAREEGEFQIAFIERPDSAGTEIAVRPPRVELDDPAMRTGALKEFAAAGTGAFMTLAEAAKLPQAIEKSLRPVESESRHTLWDSPLLAVLLALLFGVELFFRKQLELM